MSTPRISNKQKLLSSGRIPSFMTCTPLAITRCKLESLKPKKWTQYTTQGENYRITSLDYDTPYSVRLKSENQFGKGKPSVNEELRTKKERSGSELALFIVLPLLLLIILAMAIVAVIVYRRWKKNGKRSAHQTTDEEVPMYTVTAEPQNQPEATFCCAQNRARNTT
ncbi:hypothetical protein OS493_036648 [Desmophyllum pertusum]|uniref:Fibronectin type-III domain-containing protein n=1 Tax=Desmophyllum pertusum TaxID=174260 RepID=A0A9W9YUT9_9CNID|nr:hypothetical protein OS493_036648 [Desmophyllum pertusum]